MTGKGFKCLNIYFVGPVSLFPASFMITGASLFRSVSTYDSMLAYVAQSRYSRSLRSLASAPNN